MLASGLHYKPKSVSPSLIYNKLGHLGAEDEKGLLGHITIKHLCHFTIWV